ncbi:hypothetical protein CLU79DRAFT_221826 [Phycomyces nitens]|nr:hypothetical protein CLU79DRAFT_221826 [Phycomyces nitens]
MLLLLYSLCYCSLGQELPRDIIHSSKGNLLVSWLSRLDHSGHLKKEYEKTPESFLCKTFHSRAERLLWLVSSGDCNP